MLSTKEVLKKISDNNTSKDSWNSDFFEIFSYTQPERNYVWRLKGGFPGGNKQVPLYTSAGKIGASIFVARSQNKLAPYGKPYINFKPKSSTPQNFVRQLRDLSDEMSKKANDLKNELNLDDEITSSLYDLIAGTGCIMRENTINGVNFKKVSLTDFSLGTEQKQSVNRTFKLMGYKIGILFPELMDKEIIAGKHVKGADKYEEIELKDLLCYNESLRHWEYYLTVDDNDILLTRKHRTSPYHLFHWERESDMPFGTGVGAKALPDLKRINSYIKCKLELIPFAFPMFATTSGNFLDNNVTFKPGGILTVRDINALVPLPLAKDVQTFQLEIASEEMQVKQIMLDYTLPADARQMTAAEVYARSNPQDEMISVNVKRLTNVLKGIAWDLFEDIYNRELAGNMSISFDDLKSMIDCEINNDSQIDTQLIDKVNGYIQNIGMFDPSAIWASIDKANTIEKLEEAYNLPANVKYTVEEINNNFEQQAMNAAKMQQAEVEAKMAIDNNKEAAVAEREQAKTEGIS